MPLQQKDSPDSYEDDAADNTDEEKDNAYHSKGDCKTNKLQLRPKTSAEHAQKTTIIVTF